MSHEHHHSKSPNHGGNPPPSSGGKLHRDWRVWVGVILMLGCMIIYLMTMDESIVPGGLPAAPPAAANAPAQP